jgi:hypothetical protein
MAKPQAAIENGLQAFARKPLNLVAGKCFGSQLARIVLK